MMATGHASGAGPESPAQAVPHLPSGGSTRWHYECNDSHRRFLAGALLASGALHAFLLFGWPRAARPRAPPAPPVGEHALALPQLKDLEELDPVPVDDATPVRDLGAIVPMLADVPQVAAPSDFTQRVDFSTLIEKPDLTAAKVFTIPEGMRRVGKLSDLAGPIFNLADLDRHPVPIFQPSPIYPITLRREGVLAEVRVEFVVDADGIVRNPVVVYTSDPRFNDAATDGVAKWRFRAGLRAGRKVNTRMMVPVLFRVVDDTSS